MNLNRSHDFNHAIESVKYELGHHSQSVHPDRWQSVNVASRPEMLSYEVLHTSFTVPVQTEDLDVLRTDIKPNLPWADDHFEERVGRMPLNPGVQWANWPWAKSAAKFRTGDQKVERFSHTYMERYWPKFANLGLDGEVTIKNGQATNTETGKRKFSRDGIRYALGDLQDVVHLLSEDPLTRQAFLPVWFPEDTGVTHGQRVPCTLGYHFILRNSKLDIVYYLRSCDFVRHFRDDIYLTVRLQLWMLDQLRNLVSSYDWDAVQPGNYVMHVTSMHIFRNDWKQLFPDTKPPAEILVDRPPVSKA